MLIAKQFNGLPYQCIKQINATGLSDLVFQLHIEQQCSVAIFKDDSYEQAKYIHKRLGLPEPTIKEWIGE